MTKLYKQTKQRLTPITARQTSPYLTSNNLVSSKFVRVPMLPLLVRNNRPMHWNWPENHDKYLSVVTIQFKPKRSRSRFEWEDVTSWTSSKCEPSYLASGWRKATEPTNFVSVQNRKMFEHAFGYQTSIKCHSGHTNLSDLIWPWELGLVIAFVIWWLRGYKKKCSEHDGVVKRSSVAWDSQLDWPM